MKTVEMEILELLAENPLPYFLIVQKLSEKHTINKSSVTYYLTRLGRAGILEHKGQGLATYYGLVPHLRGKKLTQEAIDDLTARKRRRESRWK